MVHLCKSHYPEVCIVYKKCYLSCTSCSISFGEGKWWWNIKVKWALCWCMRLLFYYFYYCIDENLLVKNIGEFDKWLIICLCFFNQFLKLSRKYWWPYISWRTTLKDFCMFMETSDHWVNCKGTWQHFNTLNTCLLANNFNLQGT